MLLAVSVDGKALGMHRGGQTSTQLYSMVTPAGNIAIFCTASGSKLTIETGTSPLPCELL